MYEAWLAWHSVMHNKATNELSKLTANSTAYEFTSHNSNIVP